MMNENKSNKLTLKIQKRPLFNSPQISSNKNIFNMAAIHTGSKLKSSNRLRDKLNTLKSDDDIKQSFNSEKHKKIESEVKVKPSFCKNN